MKKVRQPRGAERQRGLLLGAALLLHHRDELARDEGEGDEHGGEHDAGHGEDDLEAVRHEPAADRGVGAEDQHRQRPATTGETENGRSMSVIRKALPRKSNLAIAQAAAMPKTALSGTAMAATRSVSLMAASASRSPSALDAAPTPFAAPRRRPRPAARTGSRRNSRAPRHGGTRALRPGLSLPRCGRRRGRQALRGVRWRRARGRGCGRPSAGPASAGRGRGWRRAGPWGGGRRRS